MAIHIKMEYDGRTRHGRFDMFCTYQGMFIREDAEKVMIFDGIQAITGDKGSLRDASLTSAASPARVHRVPPWNVFSLRDPR